MMTALRIANSPVTAIAATGFGSAVAQVIFIRELLTLFYGNELSTGLVFFGWLLWTAAGSGIGGRITSRFGSGNRVVGSLLTGLALMLPVSLYAIRLSRLIFAVPLGELPSVLKMVTVGITYTALFCPLSGLLFAVCWSSHSKASAEARLKSLLIYVGEALGAAGGGLVFYVLMANRFPVLPLAVSVSLLILVVSGCLIVGDRSPGRSRLAAACWCLVLLLIASAAVWWQALDNWSRRMQWGDHILQVSDTPYQNIAVVKGGGGQRSVFANGLWLLSVPDRLSAEYAVHPALLQHTHPETVLLIGGGVGGQLLEILKHPSVERIDYIEPNPDLIPLIRDHLGPECRSALENDRVTLQHTDAASYIRHNKSRYDAILMNAGDPINAGMNRFYTDEFFRQVSSQLAPEGLFSFSVSGGEEMMGPVQARFIGTIHNTLSRHFRHMLVIPGNRTRFVAAKRKGMLITDVRVLSDRLKERHLNPSYIREDILQVMLSPFRLAYIEALLSELPETAVNRDFSPTCYFSHLLEWAYQWHPRLASTLSAIAAIRPLFLWTALIVLGGVILTVFWSGGPRFDAAVNGSMMVSGAMEMVLQMILLLAFQIIAGYLYLQLVLIIAAYMAGLSLGTVIAVRWRQGATGTNIPPFRCVQAVLCLYPILLIPVLKWAHGSIPLLLTPGAVGWLFCTLSLAGGCVGGLHFSLAVFVGNQLRQVPERVGGKLYAFDLSGAAIGIALFSTYIIPVYGIMTTLAVLSFFCCLSLLTLLRHP